MVAAKASKAALAATKAAAQKVAPVVEKAAVAVKELDARDKGVGRLHIGNVSRMYAALFFKCYYLRQGNEGARDERVDCS